MSLELEERLVAKANKAKFPLTANFELSPMCNLHCDMCFIRTEKSVVERLGGLHSVDEWLDLAKQFQQLGTLFILLTGGEPLMYPGFKELYTELKKMGFIMTINTNGTLIDEEMAQLFHQYTPRRVNVTLYGSTPETYEALSHNAAGYERCMQGLRLLKQYNIDTKMNISVVKQNKAEYAQLIATAKELDMPAVVNAYMFPCMRKNCSATRHIVDERLDPDEAAAAMVEYLKYKHETDFEQFVSEMFMLLDAMEPKGPLGLECRAASSSCWVNWQQQLSPCVMMESPRVDLHQMSVAVAWKEIVERGQQVTPHEECTGCKLRTLCEVCYAGACHEKEICGNLDYLCRMTHRKREILEQYKIDLKKESAE